MIGNLLIAVLSVLLTALLTSIITRKQKDKERFKVACDELNRSFLDTITLFSSQDIPTGLYEHLVTSFPLHKKAIIDFRRHLSWLQRRGIDKAWNDYRYGTKKAYPPPEKEFPIPYLVQYYEGLKWNDSKENTKNVVLEKIHKITKYAKTR